MNLILIQCLTLFCIVLSIDITSLHLRGFPYIENAVGVHNLTMSERTPLSTQTTTWYILLNKGKEHSTIIGNGCPDNSTICAITRVDLNNGEDPFITEIFSIDHNYTHIGTHFSDSTLNGVDILWVNEDWGDLPVTVQLLMVCEHDNGFDNTDVLELLHYNPGVKSHNVILWKSQFFCNGTISDEDFNTLYPIYKKDNGWGVFSILVLVVVVVLAAYLIAQAWLYKSIIGVFK